MLKNGKFTNKREKERQEEAEIKACNGERLAEEARSKETKAGYERVSRRKGRKKDPR